MKGRQKEAKKERKTGFLSKVKCSIDLILILIFNFTEEKYVLIQTYLEPLTLS